MTVRWGSIVVCVGVAAIATAGCFSPSLEAGRPCEGEGAPCPPGQLCLDGVCTAGAPDATAGTAGDGTIGLDNVSTGQSSTETTEFSLSHTVAPGDGRILVVGAVIRSDAEEFASLAYDSLPLTRIAGVHGGNMGAELWVLVDPPVGTFQLELTATASRNLTAGAMSFSGVDPDAPLGVPLTAGASGDSTSVSVDSAPGELVVDVVGQWDSSALGSVSVGDAQLERYAVIHTGTGLRAVGSTQPGATAVVMSATFSGDPDHAQIAVPLRPLSP